MGLTAVLDTVIGLCFTYFLLALFCSWANETVVYYLNRRGKYLFVGLREMLQEGKTLDSFVRHPLVESLDKVRSVAKRAKVNAATSHRPRMNIFPSYVAASTVATVLLDVISPAGGASRFAEVRNAINEIDKNNPNSRLRIALQTIAVRADNDIDALRKGIEDWYSNTMDRVTGWYKNRTQIWLLAFGLVFAVAFNVDTFKIVRELWANPAARDLAVQAATNAKQSVDANLLNAIRDEASADKRKEMTDALIKKLDVRKQLGSAFGSAESSAIPVGWRPEGMGPFRVCVELEDGWLGQCKSAILTGWRDVLLKLIGLIVTACATALGAPFWFELVNKLLDIRGAGRKPEDKK